MLPYQDEYIDNILDITALLTHKMSHSYDYKTYTENLFKDRQQASAKIQRNTELLRDNLFPLLDNLFEASENDLQSLEEFSNALIGGKKDIDSGLFCQIRRALLNRARLKKDRNAIIRHLYWLGIGLHKTCSKMVGLDFEDSEKYMTQMRLCFAEAAAYIKYFDEIEDSETRAYILRSYANTSLGSFKSASAKIRSTVKTLQVLHDSGYRKLAPELPWDRYVYMTHQQMASNISYSRENDMTAQDIAAIMESAHIVHQQQIQEALEKNEKPPVKSTFSCYAIEYYCGLVTLEELLRKMEELMDSTDIKDFSHDNMYGIISMPAIYCQYLREYPEQLYGREEYLAQLYRKIIVYVETFPDNETNDRIFYYLRQLSSTYIETKYSISYGEFQQRLLMRFAPDAYIHSQVVGKTASVLCEIIMDEESDFFDDIEYIQAIKEPNRKKQEVMNFAMNCGAFHDIGKLNFISLYTQTSRQLFEEEFEIIHLHTIVGSKNLESRLSTKPYATIALGHHSWYDGSFGYPESYKRLKCPYRQMVDVIALIDWMDNMLSNSWLYGYTKEGYDEVVEDAIALEGKQFSPLLTARLQDKNVSDKIRQAFVNARDQSYHQLYSAMNKRENT